MPRPEDGLRVLRLLARTGTHRVVAMSIRGELRDDAIAAGACAFVEKGLSSELLMATIAAACNA
jgi:DNA-binding NarL/FixJ family response regulator